MNLRAISAASLAAWLAATGSGTAQAPEAGAGPAAAPGPAPASAGTPVQLTLDLNSAVPSESGGCRLTLVATSQLPQALARAAWQVAIFGSDGVVSALPVLDFGMLLAGKTKVAAFDIPAPSCDAIGRIVVNDVAECRAEDGADLRAACLLGLATQSRSGLEFGL